MIRSRALGCALVTSTLLLAHGANAAGKGEGESGKKDAQAEKAMKKALEEDYLQTRFDDAVQGLRAAIKLCGKDECSRRLLARLHAALGSVLAGGKRELEDARDEFVAALLLDPTIQPDPEISSVAVTFSYEQAQKKLKAIASALPGSSPGGAAAPAAKSPAEGHAPPVPPPAPLPPPVSRARRNWISVAFVPDLTLISGKDVCTSEVRKVEFFTCVQREGNAYTAYNGVPTKGNGDNINLGLGLATLRVMLGYERLLGDHVTLGARLGFAFNGGSGPVPFNPFHAEGRLAYFPRRSSFAGTIVRPYLALAGGFAQVNTKVDVEVLEDGEACGAIPPDDLKAPCTKPSRGGGPTYPRRQTLSAYKRAGYGFATLGMGIQFAPVDNFGIHVGVRGGITFPTLVPLISPEVGLSLGF